ncbi:probable ADP-ribosylation factor GTPase-activating protein AGD14 [Malania oleifera]|uniref:probable ADP-ribosylation factor GTPase-activating protein AGD14 n=1 Tax=Malania oleifera TaxID=397392 RepID=UPI0025AE6CAF|nr:probable ADP-ribosylation factor GTPase-activating protein AGD14 [Malania oleifera]
MGSRKEEERNEKIIRGLMKLPPNRRCINCNSLGPQYVCTNFWTFVCITCSGIHREFTHRVKSVSMAKFTSQEVEALQKGGNQRAREMFLNDWDSQRRRLPDSSNVDKVREFIKSVYVDRRYAGGKIHDKPPRDMQSLRNHEDQTRRASSYHSYSQSPPYDYQYEDRRYGKQAAMLTRKPGSDRGLYEGKISSFIYSPGRFSEQMYEDRFANEGSVSRVSDYSVSSGGDPVRSDTQSPNFQKDTGLSSPPIHPHGDALTEDIQRQSSNVFSEANTKRDADGIPRPQRTVSLGSAGSAEGNSVSLKSVNSGGVVDVGSEPEWLAGTYQDFKSTFQSVPQSSFCRNSGGLDLFKAPVATETVASSASSNIDLFPSSVTSSAPSVDLFQSSQLSSATPMHLHPSLQTSGPPPPNLFPEIGQKQSAITLAKNSPESSVPKNEGWATFDTSQSTASVLGNENQTSARAPSSEVSSFGKFDQNLSSNPSIQWPPFQSSGACGPPLAMYNPWPEGMHNQGSTGASMEPWNAFEDSISQLPLESVPHSDPQLLASKPSFSADRYSSLKVSQVGTLAHASDRKSTNPFDIPYESEEPNTMFLDMSPLHSALPNGQLQTSFLGGASQPWFSQNAVATFIPAAPQGGMAYMAGQAPGSQLPSVPTQGPVASIGGNPFA